MDAAVILARASHTGPEDRPELCRPFSLELDGRAYTAATDGFMMFVVDGVVGDAKPHGQRSFSHVVAETLAAARAASIPVELASLLAVAGAPERDTVADCWHCDGSGKACTCRECECQHCDGEGEIWTYAKTRKGVVCSRLVDLNRVACLLTGVDGPVFVAGPALGDTWLTPLRFCGPNWCAVLMPISPASESPDALAAYPTWQAAVVDVG